MRRSRRGVRRVSGEGMAGAPPGQELCPHCQRPFKRLRAHLPHCKAAPSPESGSAPSLAAPGSRSGSVGAGPGPGPIAGTSALRSGPGSGGPGPRSGSVRAGSPAAGSGPGSIGAGTTAPGSGPGSGKAGLGRGSGPGLIGAGPGPRSSPGSVRTGPTAKPGADTKARAGKHSKQPPSPSVEQGLLGPAPQQGEAATGEQSRGSSSRLPHQPEEPHVKQNAEAVLEDVARSLDLLPEEVTDIPQKLSNGVRIVIENHRARVVREQSGSQSRAGSAGSLKADRRPGEGSEQADAAGHAAAQPGHQEKITSPEMASTESRGPGAAEHTSASSKGEKGSSSKTIKIHMLGDPPEADCRSSPSDLAQQEGIDKTMTEEKQMYLEVGAEYKAPLSALHTKSLHLSAVEGFRGHKEGTSKHYLTSIQKLQDSTKQMAAVSESILDARRDMKLALDQFSLHTSKSQPICLSQASGRSTTAGAVGLEWFPDLYPNYDRLSIFPGKPLQEDMRIITKTPKWNFSEGQQGPLSERRLMDVRLGELPAWLATRDVSPQGLLEGVQKAWSSYHDKYINVRRGGPAGISMLLAGYCLLSYGWNYQHIKCHRWRKYH